MIFHSIFPTSVFALMSASVVLTYLRNMISIVYLKVTITMMMSLKEHEGFVVSMIVLVFGISLKKGLKRLTTLMIVSSYKGKRNKFKVSLKTMVKSLINIGLKYNNIQFELILVYSIDGTFHTPL